MSAHVNNFAVYRVRIVDIEITGIIIASRLFGEKPRCQSGHLFTAKRRAADTAALTGVHLNKTAAQTARYDFIERTAAFLDTINKKIRTTSSFLHTSENAAAHRKLAGEHRLFSILRLLDINACLGEPIFQFIKSNAVVRTYAV